MHVVGQQIRDPKHILWPTGVNNAYRYDQVIQSAKLNLPCESHYASSVLLDQIDTQLLIEPRWCVFIQHTRLLVRQHEYMSGYQIENCVAHIESGVTQ